MGKIRVTMANASGTGTISRKGIDIDWGGSLIAITADIDKIRDIPELVELCHGLIKLQKDPPATVSFEIASVEDIPAGLDKNVRGERYERRRD